MRVKYLNITTLASTLGVKRIFENTTGENSNLFLFGWGIFIEVVISLKRGIFQQKCQERL